MVRKGITERDGQKSRSTTDKMRNCLETLSLGLGVMWGVLMVLRF
jgi:hypothetical protein